MDPLLEGVVLVSAALFLALWIAAKTGDPNLDRFGIRGRIILRGAEHFGPRLSRPIVRALMAIVHQESGGLQVNYLGDKTAPGGPSVGPGQVEYATAKELGLIPQTETRDQYAARVSQEGWGIDAMVQVFKAKLAAAHGDVADAIRRYNGGGQAALGYQASALDWAQQTWPGAIS